MLVREIEIVDVDSVKLDASAGPLEHSVDMNQEVPASLRRVAAGYLHANQLQKMADDESIQDIRPLAADGLAIVHRAEGGGHILRIYRMAYPEPEPRLLNEQRNRQLNLGQAA